MNEETIPLEVEIPDFSEAAKKCTALAKEAKDKFLENGSRKWRESFIRERLNAIIDELEKFS